MFIKNSTKKILKELENENKWSYSGLVLYHKSGFGIFDPKDMLYIELYKEPIKWNIIEKFLVWKRARKVTKLIEKKKFNAQETHPFLKD